MTDPTMHIWICWNYTIIWANVEVDLQSTSFPRMSHRNGHFGATLRIWGGRGLKVKNDTDEQELGSRILIKNPPTLSVIRMRPPPGLKFTFTTDLPSLYPNSQNKPLKRSCHSWIEILAVLRVMNEESSFSLQYPSESWCFDWKEIRHITWLPGWI